MCVAGDKGVKLKTHKVDFISDIHTDFWIKEKQPSEKLTKLVKAFINDVLKPKGGDILITAGDLGHYFAQDSEVLKQLKELYKRVIVVRGNHDLYLVSGNQQDKYKANSFNRVIEMKEFCVENGIDYLDGDVIDINGLKIGGVGMWYDLPTKYDVATWNQVMNDSNLIMEGVEPVRFQYGYGHTHKESKWDTQAYYISEQEKLKSFVGQDVDVVVTHISPIITPDEQLAWEYRGDPNNIFYSSDNLDVIEEINPEVTIFGHTHTKYDFEVNKQWFVCNPLGYKCDKTGTEIQQLEITK